MADWEKQKKQILPYLQRASEIENIDRKVAYYCRLYAVDQGIHLEARHPKVDDLLELILNQLEKDKPLITLDLDKDKEHCEKFALNVLLKAKRRDEQGKADRDTAKAYYAAFNFLEILKQFGELSEDITNQRQFAVYRAAEIKRHLDKGEEVPTLTINKTDINATLSSEGSQGGGTHLIDYDPGYTTGSHVFFTEDGLDPPKQGIIKNRANEIGGFFHVEKEDGTDMPLGALFLAPDLEIGSKVTYFHPDEHQIECEIIAVDASKWPPLYVLKFVDGSTMEAHHASFTLNPLDREGTKSEELVASKIESPFRQSVHAHNIDALNSGDSWLRMKTPKSLALACKFDSGNIAIKPTSEPEENSIIDQPEKTTTPYYEPNKPDEEELSSIENVNGHVIKQRHIDSNTLLDNDNIDFKQPSLVPTPITSEPGLVKNQNYGYRPSVEYVPVPGYKPDEQVIEHVKTSVKYANNSLNFNDVDGAIKYLNEALMKLTMPPPAENNSN